MNGFDCWVIVWLGMILFWLIYLTKKYIYLHTTLIKTMKRHEDNLEDIYKIIKEAEI